jgi:hypothetical protein
MQSTTNTEPKIITADDSGIDADFSRIVSALDPGESRNLQLIGIKTFEGFWDDVGFPLKGGRHTRPIGKLESRGSRGCGLQLHLAACLSRRFEEE